MAEVAKKILVSGATGYIGGSFINKYGNNYKIIKYSLQQEPLENIPFDFHQFDTILHCAALVHRKHASMKAYQEININYPKKLAELAKRKGVKQFIFLSSVAVYDTREEVITSNTITNPKTAYGKSKLYAEEELKQLESKIFRVSIIRFPMIYGKDCPGNINNIIKLMSNFKYLPFGKIQNRRSFLFIDNLTYVINSIIRNNKSGIYLISDNEDISTTELFLKLSSSLKIPLRLFKSTALEIIIKIFLTSTYRKVYRSLIIDNTESINKLDIVLPYSINEGLNEMK